MNGHKRIAVVYEWWKSGYPNAADESVLFATGEDAEAYGRANPGGSVTQVNVWAPTTGSQGASFQAK